MRHPVGIVASVAVVLGVAILIANGMAAPNFAEFRQAASTDFAVALLEVAITVGIVDLLLKSHADRRHRESVAPRVQEFIEHLRELDAVRQQHLSSASLGDLERYRRIVADVQEGAFGLYILLLTNNSELASPLLKFSHEMREQVAFVRDAMASVQNESTDCSKRLDHVKTNGAELYASGCRLTDDLATAYPAPMFR
jgi:hypothetical protein